MGSTKEFTSAQPPQDKPRTTQPRFADNIGSQIRESREQRPSEPVPAATSTDPRSTLIMKPGQIAGQVATENRAARFRPGDSSGDALNTVIMSAESGAANERFRDSLKQHPVSRNAQPPEIELVQHEMPHDVPVDGRLHLFTHPDSKQAASFRVLRHHVMERGNPQVIAVSGPHDGCGKTTTALNLAMALAECGRAEVLLIDANLRNPRIASILRFVPPWCFSDQLDQHRNQPFLPWGFVDVSETGLHVAAINPRNDRQPRLDAPGFAIAMDRLRLGPYRHIVIDCPSVIGNADVNLIQDSTDGVLIAARTKQVTARDIRDAVDQLTPTKIIGTVLFES